MGPECGELWLAMLSVNTDSRNAIGVTLLLAVLAIIECQPLNGECHEKTT